MTKAPLEYALAEGVASIAMDDGKVNCLGFPMLEALHGALDRAERDNATAVVLRGRPGVFCGGFDLKVMAGGEAESVTRLLREGIDLSLRLLTFPAPVLATSEGHALAMGALLLLSCDMRIALQGDYRYGLNEVAIGMTLPTFAIHLARARLSPTHLARAVDLAELYDPQGAVAAGFVDTAHATDEMPKAVDRALTQLKGLNPEAYRATKARLFGPLVSAVQEAKGEFSPTASSPSAG